jgi:hypothetical protein
MESVGNKIGEFGRWDWSTRSGDSVGRRGEVGTGEEMGDEGSCHLGGLFMAIKLFGR